MLPHKKMAPAFAETISSKIFFCFFTVYLTGGTSLLVSLGVFVLVPLLLLVSKRIELQMHGDTFQQGSDLYTFLARDFPQHVYFWLAVSFLSIHLRYLHSMHSGRKAYITVGILACAILQIQLLGVLIIAGFDQSGNAYIYYISYIIPGSDLGYFSLSYMAHLKGPHLLYTLLRYIRYALYFVPCVVTAICAFIGAKKVGLEKQRGE